MIDRIGQQLGAYWLIGLLRYGETASVYLGRHVLWNAVHTIKVWSVDSLTQMVLDEVHKIVDSEHPRIIPIHYFDVDEARRLPFLVINLLI